MGQTGTGKSRLVRRIVSRLKRVIIADYMAEYTDLAEPITLEELAALAPKLTNPGAAFQYAVIGEPNDLIESCRAAWAIGRCMMVIEEIDMHCKGHFLPQDINGLVQTGRHRAVSLIGVSRNPAAIPKQFLAQSSARISFRQTEPRHIDYMYQYGFDREALKTLQRDHFLLVGETSLLDGDLKS